MIVKIYKNLLMCCITGRVLGSCPSPIRNVFYSDHVEKFHSDRPRELGDRVAKKIKKEKKHQQ